MPTDIIEVCDSARLELQTGTELSKCQQCGCMRDTLQSLQELASSDQRPAQELASTSATWLERMAPIRYACLGCTHCYPAVALNALAEASVLEAAGPSCAFEETNRSWPVVAGEYAAFCDNTDCPVAVSTLASAELADELARRRPAGLCIVGKTETENIGVDKIVKNVVSNPTIKYLIVAGRDPDGHRSGQTLLALANSGVDEHMRVIGSEGKRPILRNVTRQDVENFRSQITTIDLIGCEDADRLVTRIEELSAAALSAAQQSCTCDGLCETASASTSTAPEPIAARRPEHIVMDRAGYFVVIPDPTRQVVIVEHYTYDNQLQHVVEGTDSRSLYSTIIDKGWVTQLSHAAYLGRELARAELSLQHDFKFVQDSD